MKKTITTVKKKANKVLTGFTPQVRSRHPSHSVFRGTLGYFPVRSVIRLGSTTELANDGKRRIEINTPKAIGNSASKLKMKNCFRDNDVKTAVWYTYAGNPNGVNLFLLSGKAGANKTGVQISNLNYPIIAKGIFGSRGRANTKLDTQQALTQWLKGKDTSNYIFEEYFDGSREYRFHVSTLGVFLTWRKLRRNDTPDDQRWFFNNQTCNWVGEDNELYNKPATYKQICDECLKALNAVGLDVGACDVRVSKKGDFKIIEINSAPSMAEKTTIAYKAEFKKLITNKINN